MLYLTKLSLFLSFWLVAVFHKKSIGLEHSRAISNQFQNQELF